MTITGRVATKELKLDESMNFGPVYKELFSPKSGQVFQKIQKKKWEMNMSPVLPIENNPKVFSQTSIMSPDSQIESEDFNKAWLHSDQNPTTTIDEKDIFITNWSNLNKEASRTLMLDDTNIKPIIQQNDQKGKCQHCAHCILHS